MTELEHPSLLSRLVNLDADEIEAWEERAAIIEYDGQVPREEAEWLALDGNQKGDRERIAEVRNHCARAVTPNDHGKGRE